MSLGGRPKEEGGHKDYHLTFNKTTSEALEKVRKGDTKISAFIEKSLKPDIDNLDPGEVSVYVWQYEVYLSLKVSEALMEDNPGKAKALTTILVALKEYRNWSGVPPMDPKLLSTEKPPKFSDMLLSQFWKEREDAQQLRLNLNVEAAWDRTKRFVEILPNSPQKNDLSRFMKITDAKRSYTRSDSLNRYYNVIPRVWKEIASILREP